MSTDYAAQIRALNARRYNGEGWWTKSAVLAGA